MDDKPRAAGSDVRAGDTQRHTDAHRETRGDTGACPDDNELAEATAAAGRESPDHVVPEEGMLTPAEMASILEKLQALHEDTLSSVSRAM